MRKGIRISGAALAVLSVAVGGSASATHGGIHPTFRSEQVYFHCTEPTKVQNVNFILTGTPAPWDTSAPEQSVQEGAGCGHLDGVFYGTVPETPYDAVFKGTFTGNISSMSFELHNLLLSQARTGSTYDIGLRVSIDGEQLFGDGTTQGTRVTLTPEVSSTGLSEKMTFSIQNIGCTEDVTDADGNVVDVITKGFATEDGDGTIEHEVVVTVDQWFLNRFAGWVWDTTEVPAGITFNPEKLEPTRVQPDLPAIC